MLTIGQLAKQVGVRTSTLRYYEQEGLLQPDGRTESGYRLYTPEAVQRIRLIQRAQRLGFSLGDMRPLLGGWEMGDLSDTAILETAENRYLALERQITQRLVLRHELEFFLRDLYERNTQSSPPMNSAFDRLLARVCVNPATQSSANNMFDWLMEQTMCNLSGEAGQAILNRLRGQHSHIWQEESRYHILVVSDDVAVAQALQALAQLEANCEVHAQLTPQFAYGEEGFLFVANGENAFIYARLFLALEQESIQ